MNDIDRDLLRDRCAGRAIPTAAWARAFRFRVCLLGLLGPAMALLAVEGLLAADEAQAAQVAKGFEPEQLDLICIEQPMRAVSFGAPGELSYGEQPPKASDPIEVLVSKSRPGEDFNYDFATIESSAEDLQTEEAIWMTGKQIEAQQGRFKINLSNLMMTLTETDPDGSARFRRFECEQRSVGNGGGVE
jgi:hypothetical protein